MNSLTDLAFEPHVANVLGQGLTKGNFVLKACEMKAGNPVTCGFYWGLSGEGWTPVGFPVGF